MFNKNFFPTPKEIIKIMCPFDIKGKIFLEPQCGKGDIVDFLYDNGAKDVIGCEIHDELRKISQTKCKIISHDFFTLESHQISHIDAIVMNPPFDNADKHIIHAFNIAPPGCIISTICNSQTLKTQHSKSRQELSHIISQHSIAEPYELQDTFAYAERTTNVEVYVILLKKPGEKTDNEFEGFFLDEEPDDNTGISGLMPYNFVRDLVNRYVGAVKLYDEQLEIGIRMNALTSGFYKSEHGFSITEDAKPKSKNDFKKDLQKSGWNFIFNKMNMQKHSTKGLKEDINKFVEQQHHIPFTMKNIYVMLDIIIGTTGQRMDKSLLEVFDKLTSHYDDNRFNLPGWKTNSHYLINQKFILPYMAEISWSGELCVRGYGSSGNSELVEDFVKALCYISGENYSNHETLYQFIRESKPGFGSWFDWGFFKVKAFKKGTMHFEFKDIDLWGKFNQHISRIKGYPLFEAKEQTAWQKRQNKSTNKQAA